jgi:photosystem II stability/assembly factor-like uncharacterized protein
MKQSDAKPTIAAAAPLVLSRGHGRGDANDAAGTYQAFPDACRLRNGDIAVVFYAGYQHVSLPRSPDWPRGGRICLVRSRDEGRTWSAPEVIYDDPEDNRDPHIAQLPDGSLAVTFFSLRPNGREPNGFEGTGCKIVYSRDGGRTWERQARTLTAPDQRWFCSAPVRVLPSGTWMLGVYKYDSAAAQIYGGVLRSTDRGRTWGQPIPIGKGQDILLDAETDVIALKNGTLFAALRRGKPAGAHMHYATSTDDGKTWTPARDIGFPGHAPFLYRLRNGTILLAHRLPQTALHLSRDEGRTWQGPYEVDNVHGAYPSIVELKDGTILIVYYTEGKDSEVRARRFRIEADGIQPLPPYRFNS